jgi:uncharacterized lipoprotein YmbA
MLLTLKVFLANGLTACASSPAVEFFALEPASTVDHAAIASSSIVQVARVHVPAALDRPEIVRRSGLYSVEISDRHRWSAPLDAIIQRVLTQDLLQRLPAANVVLPQEPAPPGTRKLVVDILKFEADPSGIVQFDASWSLLPSNPDEPLRNRYVHLSELAGSQKYADEVEAMSRILEQLAAQIAQAVAAGDSALNDRPAP